MSEVQRFWSHEASNIRCVREADFDRVTAERDAALAELSIANEKIDKAWNRTSAIDHKGFIPGAMDAWKRPVKQHLPYDFSGNPGASATQYCNGWNDCGGYWSAHTAELQQRLTAADERADVLEGLLRESREAHACLAKDIAAERRYQSLPGWMGNAESDLRYMQAKIDAALKPAEGGGDEQRTI